MKTELTDAELVIYSRQIALEDIDYQGQLKLLNASACIVGLGGLGSLLALKLAAMGIGRLRLVDRDIVSLSDLHRQLLYCRDQVGLPKVAAAKQRLALINPEVELELFPQALTPANARDLVQGVDVVLDGLDAPQPRYALNRACVELGIPWVFGAAIEVLGNVTTVIPGKSTCLECFMPGLKDEDLPKCAVVGVHPGVLGIVTSIQVSEAVRLLVGQEPTLLNRLLYVDLRSMDFHKIELAPDQACPACGQESLGDPAELSHVQFDESCAKNGARTFFYIPPCVLDLDLEAAREGLWQEGWNLQKDSAWGFTAQREGGYSLSLLKSGIAIMSLPPGPAEEPREQVREFCQALILWAQEGEGRAPAL